ncbi:hypothetical protein DFH09DRAFT_1219119, partial [Mycena vulgaris]
MTTALTFVDKTLLDSPIVAGDGAVHYTTTTTQGFTRRKMTTLMAASGVVGMINWREKTFTINGVQWRWDDLNSRSAGIFSSEREWNWAGKPYKVKYHRSDRELLVRPWPCKIPIGTPT